MTPRLLVLGLVLLLVGCSGENDPPEPVGPAEVQLVDGQAVCDSCASVRIVLSGPGIVNVTEATLVTSGATRTPVPARIVLTHESGEVLVVSAYFDAGISAGEFDLWLDPVNDDEDARVVPAALLVTRARPGLGDLATVRVWVQASGIDRDGRFLLRTMAGCQAVTCDPVPVEAYEAAAMQVHPGAYTFQLDDVASNCTVSGAPNPFTLTLERGRVTALTYQVACTQSMTPAWVRVANVTTGIDLDDEYLLSCSKFACLPFKLAANSDTVLRVVPGGLSITLGERTSNCTLTGASPVSVTAVVGDTAVIGFTIECRAAPGIRVTIRTTGRDIDPDFQLRMCDGQYIFATCNYRSTQNSDVIAYPGLQPGTYFISLWGLAENCAVTGENSRTVEVLGGTVDVTFDVVCRAYGTVRVSVVTTGTNQDLSFQLVRPASCDDYYYICERNTLTASASLDFRLPPVPQSFQLLDVATNCVVAAPSLPATVIVPEDGLVALRFEVACQ